jgi:hypothetical protein
MITEGIAVGYADTICQPGGALDAFVLEDAKYRPENHEKYLQEIDEALTDSTLDKASIKRLNQLKDYFIQCGADL